MDDTRARGTGTHSGKCGIAVFEVFVPGHPAPQGSKRHVGNGVMIESSRRVKTWRDDAQVIALAATKRLANLGETPGCHIAVYPVEPNQ